MIPRITATQNGRDIFLDSTDENVFIFLDIYNKLNKRFIGTPIYDNSANLIEYEANKMINEAIVSGEIMFGSTLRVNKELSANVIYNVYMKYLYNRG